MTIAVIGEKIIDRYIFGTTTRLSQEAPVGIVKHDYTEDRPGGAYNVFKTVERFDPDAIYSVECDAPPIKMRIYSGSYYITRVDFNDDGCEWKLLDEYKNASTVIISDYDKGLFNDLKDLKNLPRQVIVDPKKLLHHYKGAWCLKPNRKEFEQYAGKWKSEQELKKLMIQESIDLEIEHLIVTLGSDGIAYYNSEYGFFHEHSHVQECIDPCSAGDAVTAILAVFVDRGYPMIEAIKLANKAAAIAISHIGTYQVTPEDLV
jgi:rfaE bifunctional protein kinase chain/domain